MSMWTGSLAPPHFKVTPGHDPTRLSKSVERHHLAIISILDEEAKINQNGGPYQGMDRFECRKNLWQDMEAAGLVIKEENVPIKGAAFRSAAGRLLNR